MLFNYYYQLSLLVIQLNLFVFNFFLQKINKSTNF